MDKRGDHVVSFARPFTDTIDFDPLLARIGAARVVQLGEASHGTHEFYQWRAVLTRRLISECGFSFVAVEGDWPDCERVDGSVRCAAGAPEDPRAALDAFERWPTWMWANDEVVDFCRWLRRWNAARDKRRRVGFHGLDVYSLWESMRAILVYLREYRPGDEEAALRAYRCFEPYAEDPQEYALALRFVPQGCHAEVVGLLSRLRERAVRDGAAEFAAWQHAEVVAGAERYYRAMLRGGGSSWNVRDVHMADTLDRLLDHYGSGARAVVWAHNTHVGDARATDMAGAGMVNLGQLARGRHGSADLVLVGFGCHRGSVIAADRWGAPAQVMPVPDARPGSVEDLLHTGAPQRALFVFPAGDRPRWLTGVLGHRAIGVVYHPQRDRGNYVPTRLAGRYDAFCWFDETSALRPLHLEPVPAGELETYPSGV